MSGIHVGNLYENQKVFEVVVWSTPETRHSLSDVQELMIDTPDGGGVRLGDVADVRIVPASTVIHHDAVKRYIDVIADVEGRALDPVAADIRDAMSHLQFPLEYHAEVQGDYAEQRAVRSRLLIILLAAAISALVVLQAAFGSWRLAAVYFPMILAALAGGLLLAVLAGTGMSFGALAGLLAVFGIATCDMIALIRRCQRLECERDEPFGEALVLRTSSERLVPLVMTSLAFAAVFVPALFLGDRGGLEILKPMTVVLLGGLLTSGVVNAFLLPPVYSALGIAAAEEMDPLAGSEDSLFDAMPGTAATAHGE